MVSPAQKLRQLELQQAQRIAITATTKQTLDRIIADKQHEIDNLRATLAAHEPQPPQPLRAVPSQPHIERCI